MTKPCSSHCPFRTSSMNGVKTSWSINLQVADPSRIPYSFSTSTPAVRGLTPGSNGVRSSGRKSSDHSIISPGPMTPHKRLNGSYSFTTTPGTVATNLNNSSRYYEDDFRLDMNELGVAPIDDDLETSPIMFTPRANSRVVRIVSKHSNV